ETGAFVELTREMVLACAAEERLPLLRSYLAGLVAASLKIGQEQIAPEQPLSGLGLDSLAAVELRHAVESGLGVAVPMSSFLEGVTLSELSARLLAGIMDDSPKPDARIIRVHEDAEHP